jgi:hypothetical protein
MVSFLSLSSFIGSKSWPPQPSGFDPNKSERKKSIVYIYIFRNQEIKNQKLRNRTRDIKDKI